MLKEPEVVLAQPDPQAQKVTDLHQQVIMTTTMVPYPIVGSEAMHARNKSR